MRPLLTAQLAVLVLAGTAVSASALTLHLPHPGEGIVIEVQSTGGGSDGGGSDGGGSDGGGSDGGGSDGGSTDGGSTDGGSTDGGSTDGGGDGGESEGEGRGGYQGDGSERMDAGPPVYGSYQNVTVYGLQIQSAVDDCVEAYASAPSEEGRFLACIGDALDVFAARLDSDQVALPESGAEIPQIIRRAAAAVRAAPSAEAARRVVQAAASDVAKTIELIRATDSDPGRTLARQSGSIVESLAAVDSGLLRATGI